MRTISNILGAIALLIGMGLGLLALTPMSLISEISNNNIDASAFQMTQLYSEGMYYGTLAIVAFMFVVALQINNIASMVKDIKEQQITDSINKNSNSKY